jgi:hypothetical protein
MIADVIAMYRAYRDFWRALERRRPWVADLKGYAGVMTGFVLGSVLWGFNTSILGGAAIGVTIGITIKMSWSRHRRRKEQIDQQAELAVTQPPEHVRELIGERPVSGVRLAQQWERLAEQIERHRLRYGLDVNRHGPLDPDPSKIARHQRAVYEQRRHKLATEIERYRQARSLPAHEQAREITATATKPSPASFSWGLAVGRQSNDSPASGPARRAPAALSIDASSP